jgi:uncharacterized protein
MKKTKLYIKGMHCISCEMLLEKEFKKIPSLKSCKVSHQKGFAELECDENLPRKKIKSIIRSCGYKLVKNQSDTKQKERQEKPKFSQILAITLGLLIIFYIIAKIDFMRFLPSFGGEVTVVIALLMGIVASLSTCLAITGGIVMSFGATVQVAEGSKNHFLARAMPHIYFHIGRIGGFILLGGLLGLIGSKINYSLSFTGYLTILIAIVMLYMGLQILNIVPNITKLGFHLPKFLSRKIHDLEKSDHHLMPTIIGALTFFLPCGFTQSMQLAAVTSQNFLSGALIMGAFAIGTMPVLFSVGIGSTYAHKEKMKIFYNIIGVIIIFFSVYSFNSGLILAGSPVTIDVWNQGQESSVSEVSGDMQVVKMDIDWTFQPSEFEVKKGIPVRWEINGINVSGCSNQIVIPQMNITKDITSGINIVEFTPEKEGVIPFSCWMGMQSGRFIVTD